MTNSEYRVGYLLRQKPTPPPVYPVGEKQFAACYLDDGERKAVVL